MPITKFDPMDDPHGHAPIVFRQFADGINVDGSEGARILRRLFHTGAQAAVWFNPDNAWVVIGFAIVAAAPQTVIWCWTRPVNRTPKDAKICNGVMTTLLAKLDVDFAKPVLALYRSPAAVGIQRRGRHVIVFADEQPQQKATT